jgi:hypothetical protein
MEQRQCQSKKALNNNDLVATAVAFLCSSFVVVQQLYTEEPRDIDSVALSRVIRVQKLYTRWHCSWSRRKTLHKRKVFME